MKFTTRMAPIGDALDGKRVMTQDDSEAWIAAGLPPLKPKQLRAFGRALYYNAGEDPEDGATMATVLLAQPSAIPPSPSHIPNGASSSRPTKSGRTAGNPPKAKIQTASKIRKRAKKQLKLIRRHLLDRGADPGEVKIMMDADVELVQMWAGQVLHSEPASSHSPLGMDDSRYQLHRDAKAQAARWLAADPNLDPGAAYSRAALELDEPDAF